jgi:hypothetical protein
MNNENKFFKCLLTFVLTSVLWFASYVNIAGADAPTIQSVSPSNYVPGVATDFNILGKGFTSSTTVTTTSSSGSCGVPVLISQTQIAVNCTFKPQIVHDDESQQT